jgi:hypothetical protein
VHDGWRCAWWGWRERETRWQQSWCLYNAQLPTPTPQHRPPLVTHTSYEIHGINYTRTSHTQHIHPDATVPQPARSGGSQNIALSTASTTSRVRPRAPHPDPPPPQDNLHTLSSSSCMQQVDTRCTLSGAGRGEGARPCHGSQLAVRTQARVNTHRRCLPGVQLLHVNTPGHWVPWRPPWQSQRHESPLSLHALRWPAHGPGE